MKRLLRPALLLAAAAPLAFAAAPILTCGQPQPGQITALDKGPTFVLPAATGDNMLIRLIPLTTGMSFSNPAITLQDSASAGVREAANGLEGGGMFTFLNLNRDSYTITVNGSTAGSFLIAYVPLNRLCPSGTVLTCGVPLKSAVGNGQIQPYQFNGKIGDAISLRLSTLSGGDPAAAMQIVGFDSSAAVQLVGPNQPLRIAFTGPTIIPYRLTSDGQQTLVIMENSGQLKLNYALNLLNFNGPCSAVPAGCGSAADGAISDPLGAGLFTLSATKGDVFRFRAVPTDAAGGLVIFAQLFDPQGAVLSPTSSDSTGALYTMAATGQYTVVVQDASGINTGKYALSVTRLNSPCNAQPLGCGTPTNGQVTGPLRTVTYSVDAQAGDVYMLRLLRTGASPSFTPRIEVYAPDTGSQVQSISTADQGSVTFTAPAAGTYTLIAFDGLDGKQSGSYSVWLGRLNRPCSGSVGLTCLFLAPGTIGQPLQTGLYSYPTAAGDAFTVRLLDTGGSLQSALQVYDPRGLAILPVPGTTKAVDVTGSPGGVYTILVTDQSRTPQQGTFGLEAISTKGGCGSPVPQGLSVNGLISGPAPLSTYLLQASAGDALLARVAAFTPGFAANMDLYDPAGKRLGSGTSAVSPPTLVTGGVYTAVIAASAPRGAGNYAFSWQLLNNPAANPLACGRTTSGTLGPDNQFWYYSLSASEGDLLKLLLTRLPGTLNAQVELFDARGARLAVNSNEIARKAGAGNYLVLVSPASATAETGGFALALERPNNPCAPNALACGQTILQQVAAPGQLDVYPFSASAGDQINIAVTPRAGNISPVTELYDPSGNAVGSPATTALTATLAAAGQYSVTVHDRSGNTGSYRVGLQHANNSCPENDSEKPAITLRRPTGGDVITGGAVFQIVWQSDDNEAVASHAIGLSADGGKTFQPIAGATALSGVAQSFNWLVPADIAPTRTAVIQVTATDRAGNTQSAASDLLTLIGSGFTPNASVIYEYDALNRLSQAAYQDGRIISYGYDGVGNLISITVQ